MNASTDLPPRWVLEQWPGLSDARVSPISSGLINATYAIDARDGRRLILQRLHEVFSERVNLDMAAITGHLADKGMLTPRLLPTLDDRLWVRLDEAVWRVQTRLPGITHNFMQGPAMAGEAGGLVARFHAALQDLRHDYRSGRAQVHDTQAHLQRLRQALSEHRGHRLYDQVAHLADFLLQRAGGLVDLSALPLRHAHGDLKISNLLFDEHGSALALIDLDTLALMHWPLEMGDALRSWCNPRKEDQLSANLDLDLLAAAVRGYRQVAGDMISEDEWRALIPGLARICLELSARFLADALNEAYFGWDDEAYPARGEHNLARGASMWTLYTDVMNKRVAAERLVFSG